MSTRETAETIMQPAIGKVASAIYREMVEAIDAALTKAIADEREAKWLPIGMAPKGLKLIVGYFNPLGKWRSVMGRYYFDGTLEGDTDESGFAPAGWYDTEAHLHSCVIDRLRANAIRECAEAVKAEVGGYCSTENGSAAKAEIVAALQSLL